MDCQTSSGKDTTRIGILLAFLQLRMVVTGADGDGFGAEATHLDGAVEANFTAREVSDAHSLGRQVILSYIQSLIAAC